MPPALLEVTDGVHVGALFPRHLFNTVVVEGPEGDVVIDAGFPWSGRRLARFTKDRTVVEHAVTHAHGDHVGSTAWLCAHTGAPLAMSDVEADDFEHGSVAWHAGVAARYGIAPLAHRRRVVDRRLAEGDTVGGFEVVAQPGHSPGLLAFWRAADRTLIVGDGPINLSTDPTDPHWLRVPDALHHDPAAAVASRRRLQELEPDLVVSTHGHPVRGLDRWAAGVGAAGR
ncbi:MBL fold metallo-hydrolase [Actinomycetospora sp. TBRC 11914]|uniref:MBL fold metallo-hydrolase n=1 Tax=Actinomycetospora sp. TBRC 11914 TaxID=2729387 RepID=UPI00145CE219|nr:MBL fold metallo-hydrolase [Actinomycetospora sp. TBRC 11914]NMO91384.1 MBL fold metallo-hydrolase [Actinomycetospora sp. TBRC 11914]